MISVGSDVACDWQIRAAFVPGRAFSLLIVGGRTFLRSGPEPGVLLDGKAVDDGWVQVPHGARIDVGLARLEVTMGYADTSGQLVESLAKIEQSTARTVSTVSQVESKPERRVGRITMNLGSIPITPMEPSDSLDELEDLMATTRRPALEMPSLDERPADYEHMVTAPRARGAKPRNATIELQLEDLYVEPNRELDAQRRAAIGDVPQARLLGHQSGEFDVGAAPRDGHDMPAPSLLDVEEPSDKRRWRRYAVASVVTAAAYGGWLVLLDRF
ncbi:MAG: hypothetical protein JWN48_2184 [Myxococcaceae bacterium]|nr:hypothetical protein [Myxococcaceae bacterium]